jgi:GT2 family glycosyltransferase
MIQSVCAVILTWNALEDSRKCIRSLNDNGYPDLQIVVVDNGSKANDAAILQAEFPAIEAIRLEGNHGFARGVNIGAYRALQLDSDAILLLNNDAIVPTGNGMLEALVGALNVDSKIGAAGPVLVDAGEPLIVQNAGLTLSLFFPIPKHIDRGAKFPVSNGREHPGFLSGGCMLVRSDVFARLGGLDADFFLYFEDADFALRLRALGYRERVVRSQYIFHDKSKTIREFSARYIYTSIRGCLIFLCKHACWYHWPTAALTMIAISIGLPILSKWRRHTGGLAAALRAWSDVLAGRWGGFDGTWPPDEASRDLRTFIPNNIPA